ncbi:MAG: C1 family peptidase [Legionella sp.]
MKLKTISFQSIKILILFGLMIQGLYAEDVLIVGNLKHTLRQNSTNLVPNKNQVRNEKVIQLLRVQLSDEEQKSLSARGKNALTSLHKLKQTPPNLELSLLPNSVKLGMNNIPVLDQGMHGTCVTFAITGALDAALAKGDYISQLCHLQLGSYLEKHSYGVSGWNGSNTHYVVHQIEEFGIINKEKQQKLGCGGLSQYPTYSVHVPESYMDPQDFYSKSELIFGKTVNWTNVYQRGDSIKTLNDVKQTIHEGDRLVFAVLLPRVDLGAAGAVGKYKTWFSQDTWLLTPEVLAGLNSIEAAHELIITGYDDNAIAVDDHGKQHKGLLFLRNSWGSGNGDYGDFYMSYDYFKLLSFEVVRFSPTLK